MIKKTVFTWVWLSLFVMMVVGCSSTEEMDTVQSETVTLESERQEEDENEHEEDDHSDEEDRKQGIHAHGSAELTVAWSGNEILIQLDTPAYNLFGFEYTPTTAEEQELVVAGEATLKDSQIWNVNSEAACSLQTATVDFGMNSSSEEEEVEEAHSDVTVIHKVICSSPLEIRSLDLSPLFGQFPLLGELDVTWLSDAAQSAQELMPDSPILSLQTEN